MRNALDWLPLAISWVRIPKTGKGEDMVGIVVNYLVGASMRSNSFRKSINGYRYQSSIVPQRSYAG